MMNRRKLRRNKKKMKMMKLKGEDNTEEEHSLRTSPSKRYKNPSSNICKESEGQKVGKTLSGEVLYIHKCVRVRDLNIGVGGAVIVEDDLGEAIICFVEYMYEKQDGIHDSWKNSVKRLTNCPWQCCK
jgi:DNA (cytosine-5)-methyltransferase 1